MKDEMKRYRFNVPLNDKSVLKWISNQSNVSSSIRQLIRDDIRRNGFSDYTCRDVMPFVSSDDVKSDENLSTVKSEIKDDIVVSSDDVSVKNVIQDEIKQELLENEVQEEIQEEIRNDYPEEEINDFKSDDDSGMDDFLASMLS